MWSFTATYQNMDNGEDRKQMIIFDGQFVGDEYACYIHAMKEAYNEKGKDECLLSIDFMSC